MVPPTFKAENLVGCRSFTFACYGGGDHVVPGRVVHRLRAAVRGGNTPAGPVSFAVPPAGNGWEEFSEVVTPRRVRGIVFPMPTARPRSKCVIIPAVESR